MKNGIVKVVAQALGYTPNYVQALRDGNVELKDGRLKALVDELYELHDCDRLAFAERMEREVKATKILAGIHKANVRKGKKCVAAVKGHKEAKPKAGKVVEMVDRHGMNVDGVVVHDLKVVTNGVR